LLTDILNRLVGYYKPIFFFSPNILIGLLDLALFEFACV